MADHAQDTIVVAGGGAAPREAAPTLGGLSRPVLGERYEILGMLGSGGMGNVYKARDLELDELVALKVLRPELVGDPEVLDRFRLEVRLARKVTHPNVARTFDIGEHEGERFLTMEFIDGETLGALLAREQRLSIEGTLEIASAVCAGLGAAHAAGVVHLDLKPENVLLGKDGRVAVTDFGLACAAAGARPVESATRGTPAYMAPEQLAMGPSAGPRVDLYAFGVMLYEMLVGERPFHGGSVRALLSARVRSPVPDPREKRPDVPTPLAALVVRCMARTPEDRPAGAEDVAGELAVVTFRRMAIPPSHRRPPSITLAPVGHKHVAVLPFQNMGPPDQEYIAEGLTEDLIDLLSMAEGLRVRSRSVVMRYKGVVRDPREIGRELDVQVVVEGSVRRVGGVVQIRARLVSVSDGVQLWAQRFDRPDAELLTINDDAARAIAGALTSPLGAPARRSADPAAIELYLRARSTYQGFLADQAGEPIALFEQALALSPGDPLILAGYAMARARFWNSDAQATAQAKAAAEQAVALAPDLPDSHVALGAVRFHGGDPVGAIRPLRKALSLARGNAAAHDLLGRILAESTRLDDAMRHLEIAVALDPSMDLPKLAIVRVHMSAARWDEGERALRALDPTLDTLAASTTARLCLWRRDVAMASDLLPRIPAKTPMQHMTRALLELVIEGKPPYHTFPHHADPTKLMLRARAFFHQLVAECASFLGEREQALAAVEQASRLGLFDLPWMDACPLLEPLRGEPQFLAARAGVAERCARVVHEYLAPAG